MDLNTGSITISFVAHYLIILNYLYNDNNIIFLANQRIKDDNVVMTIVINGR